MERERERLFEGGETRGKEGKRKIKGETRTGQAALNTNIVVVVAIYLMARPIGYHLECINAANRPWKSAPFRPIFQPIS